VQYWRLDSGPAGLDISVLRGDDFIVHDPWGNALREYRERNGRQLLYPYTYLHAKTRVQKSSGKWAHFIRP
jgi:hypothetical protein